MNTKIRLMNNRNNTKLMKRMVYTACFGFTLLGVNILQGMFMTGSGGDKNPEEKKMINNPEDSFENFNLKNNKIQEEEIKKLREEITKQYPEFNEIFCVSYNKKNTWNEIDGDEYVKFMSKFLGSDSLWFEFNQKTKQILQYYIQQGYKTIGNESWVEDLMEKPENLSPLNSETFKQTLAIEKFENNESNKENHAPVKSYNKNNNNFSLQDITKESFKTVISKEQPKALSKCR